MNRNKFKSVQKWPMFNLLTAQTIIVKLNIRFQFDDQSMNWRWYNKHEAMTYYINYTTVTELVNNDSCIVQLLKLYKHA